MSIEQGSGSIGIDGEHAQGVGSLVVFTPEMWEQVAEDVTDLFSIDFDLSVQPKILGEIIDEDGEKNDYISYNSLEEAVKDPQSAMVLLRRAEDSKVIGLSYAMPIGRMDGRRADEEDTAYIYFSAIHKDYEGRRLVWAVTDEMMRLLDTKGYSYAERDSKMHHHFAENMEERYRHALTEAPYDDNRFGPMQRHFRIAIRPYVASLPQLVDNNL